MDPTIFLGWAHAVTGELQDLLEASGRQQSANVVSNNMNKLDEDLNREGALISQVVDAQASRIRDFASTIALTRRDLETILAHPEYSLERVRADIRGILEERL